MLEQTDAITKEVLEPFTFVLAYPTVYIYIYIYIYKMYSITVLLYIPIYTASAALMTSTWLSNATSVYAEEASLPSYT
jgi:hypothetical protein